MNKILTGLACLMLSGSVFAQTRIKDIADVDGARTNQLTGFGLVVGLDGTGSRSPFTQQVAVDMLQRMNVSTTIFIQQPSDNVIRSTSISAVMVTATLGPYHRKGQKIDVTVSALDDARSLAGGVLIMTPLKGADKEVYAVAQGPLSVGGFAVAGQSAGLQKNQLNVGRIANGAIVEKEAIGEVLNRGKIRFLLKEADFTTAKRVAKVINDRFPDCALAQDAGAVVVSIPRDKLEAPAAFLGELSLLEVNPDTPAKVVINERTGTIVSGENVVIHPAAVAHGNLFIARAEFPLVSQPGAFAGGATAIVPRTAVGATEERTRLNPIPKAATVGDVARALNSLGVTPRDLIAIFQALKEAGALNAELVFI